MDIDDRYRYRYRYCGTAAAFLGVMIVEGYSERGIPEKVWPRTRSKCNFSVGDNSNKKKWLIQQPGHQCSRRGTRKDKEGLNSFLRVFWNKTRLGQWRLLVITVWVNDGSAQGGSKEKNKKLWKHTRINVVSRKTFKVLAWAKHRILSFNNVGTTDFVIMVNNSVRGSLYLKCLSDIHREILIFS